MSPDEIEQALTAVLSEFLPWCVHMTQREPWPDSSAPIVVVGPEGADRLRAPALQHLILEALWTEEWRELGEELWTCRSWSARVSRVEQGRVCLEVIVNAGAEVQADDGGAGAGGPRV